MSRHGPERDGHGFHRLLATRKVGEAGLVHDIAATDEERAHLAGFLGVISVEALQVSFRIQRWRARGLKLEGLLRARVVQSCVVTLEPVESAVETRFERRFLPAEMIDPGGEAEEVFVDPDGEDPPEPLTSEVDLGAIAVEELALGLDPYPRKPGSIFAPETSPAADKPAASPFAALGRLKGRLAPKP
jgi:uncharacterized metal-binding protein YceD (DUF177 family)